jgi:23S rRNA (guanosine2251-2'-O)-methyltransferase
VALLIGVNPVREALRARHSLDRVLIAKGAGGPRLQEIIDLARQQGVAVRFEPRDALNRMTNDAAHQGVVGIGAAKSYQELDEVPTNAQLVVVLDGVEDPHNLGAIIRTAYAAGSSAIVIPDRRAAGLTETVAKASAGAIEYLPIVRVANVRQALEKLKKQGFWIYGLDERGDQPYDRVAYATPTAFVLGGEGKGLHEHVKKDCDFLIRIPMAGEVSSLNVSVATGVVLFHFRSSAQAKQAT